jgi:uncharacterized damage-inducible protein DinB
MSEQTTRSFDRAIPKLRAARQAFIDFISSLPPDLLEHEPAPGEWSPHRLVQHLYLGDDALFRELQRVVTEDNPEIAHIEEEGPVRTRAAELLPLPELLAAMSARRAEIEAYLERLPEEAWQRPCRHHLWGDLKLYQLVNVFANHDRLHTDQARRAVGA